ncbi:MAG: hypothetical protein ACLR13_04450 [Acutalibacteraceae bacterium]
MKMEILARLWRHFINHPDIKKVYLRHDNDDKGYEAAIATQRILQQNMVLKQR